MGIWSGMGTIAKNGVKIAAGYALGDMAANTLSDGDDAINGAGGFAGIAAIYAVPAIGSKLKDFIGSHKKEENLEVSEKKGFWSSLPGKILVKTPLIAGGAVVGVNVLNWVKEYADAHDNIHDAGTDEFLRIHTTPEAQTDSSAQAEQDMPATNAEQGVSSPESSDPSSREIPDDFVPDTTEESDYSY